MKPDRATSYYYYSLAKFYDVNGEFNKALSEMRRALKYDPASAVVHIELAKLLDKLENNREAIEQAQEAAKLDPTDPDPHWLLAKLLSRTKPQPNSSPSEGMLKAIQELEKIKELTPDSERIYFALGGAYFDTDQPEKAIQAFEKFQSLASGADDGYKEIAKYYEHAGNEEKALEYRNKAYQAQPDSPENLAYLGDLYSRLGKTKEAIEFYSKLRDLNGNDPNVNRSLAASYIDAGQFSEALKLLNELAKSKSNDSYIAVLRGRALLGERQPQEAITILKPVVEAESANIEANFYLGSAYELSGMNEEAVKIFSHLLTIVRDDSEETRNNRLMFQQRLASNYRELRNYEKAIAVCQEMIKIDPKKGNTELIDTYRQAKQYDQAISLGKQLYEKGPAGDKDDNFTNSTISYAHALADAGKAKEGAEVLNKLLQSQQENIDIYFHLSQIYLQGKRFEDAEKVLLRAENRKPDTNDFARLKFLRAEVYEKQKDFDRAESMCREILRTNPNNATALNYIGYMLADRGVRLDEALKYVQEALVIEPNNGAYLDSLGWAFFKMNDMPNAEKNLLKADLLTKNDPVINEHLGDLYSKIGNLQKAQEFYSHSIKLGSEQEEVKKVQRKLEVLQESLQKQKTAK